MAGLPGLSLKMPGPKSISGSRTKVGIPGFSSKIPKGGSIKQLKLSKFKAPKITNYSSLVKKVKATKQKGLGAIIKARVKEIKGL